MSRVDACNTPDVQESWESVAEQVKRRRLERGLSQRGAADAAGVSPTTWQSLELHHKSVGDLTKAGIARALGWPIDAIDRLLDGEDPADFEAAPQAPTAPDDSWDDLKSSLSEQDRAAVRAIIESLRTRNH